MFALIFRSSMPLINQICLIILFLSTVLVTMSGKTATDTKFHRAQVHNEPAMLYHKHFTRLGTH